MNEFIRMLIEKPGFVHLSPASDISICEAEEHLQAKFSDEYRSYLSVYGCASFAGHELTGISGFSQINVVSVTLDERTLNEKIPHNLYVIEQAHIDGIVVWQDETGRIYYSQPNQSPVKKFNSLLEYISQ